MPQIICKKCGKLCKSLQGWKMHMSGAHGGFDQNDLQEVLGSPSSPDADARQRMENFASAIPPIEGELNSPAQEAPPSPPPQAERRIKATPKRMKKFLGSIPSKVLEVQGIEIDSEDREMLDEAAEFLADVFGFEFSVPESKYVIQSRFWAVVWVGAMTGMVYLKHKLPTVVDIIKAQKAKADLQNKTAAAVAKAERERSEAAERIRAGESGQSVE